MAARKYALGLDYGTESARAVLLAVDDGEEIGSVVCAYADGVIDVALPVSGGAKLPADWALQNPQDYFALLESGVPRLLRETGVSAPDVVGIGVDCTACTLLPIDSAG